MSYRRTTGEEVDEIVRLWLYEHKSYEQIRNITTRSLDTISRKIKEYREKYPDIEEVRETNARVKEDGLTIPDVLRTFHILDGLEKLGIPHEQLPGCRDLLQEYGNQAQATLEAGLRISALEKETGLSFSQIEARYQSLDRTNQTIATLEERKTSLESELENLTELKSIQNELRANQIGVVDLSNFIQLHNELHRLDFTSSAARLLAAELAITGLTGEEGSKKVAEMLREYETTTRAIETKRGELTEVEKQRTEAVIDLNLVKQEAKEVRENTNSSVRKFSEDKARQQEELSKVESKKQSLDQEVSELDKKREEKSDALHLAESVMTLVTNPKGLSMAQLETLLTRLNRAKEDREKSYHNLSEQQVLAAVSVLSDCLNEKTAKRVLAAESERYSALESINRSKQEMQKLTTEVKKRDQVVATLSGLFTRGETATPLPWVQQLGYDCPKCSCPFFLTPGSLKVSIAIRCPNCHKESKPTLIELYEIVLKNEN